MYRSKILLLAACVCAALAQTSEDPLCVLKGCPNNKPCRVVTECVAPGACSLRALCMDNLPQWSHTGVCQIGQPILTMRDGAWGDTHCGPTLPCPNATYCNSELMDTYATCCRSDPTNAVKPGNCPVRTISGDNDTRFCSDSCNNDGDCRHDWKCCQVGCERSCLPPQKENFCQTKKCPEGTHCLTPEMPQCTAPGQCYNVGDCIPCGPLCKMACPGGFEKDPLGCPVCRCKRPPPCGPLCKMACPRGFEKDPLGCPVCRCKPPPPRVRSSQNVPSQTSHRPGQAGGILNSLLWAYLMNNQLL